jgi:hypothetical protein
VAAARGLELRDPNADNSKADSLMGGQPGSREVSLANLYQPDRRAAKRHSGSG